MTIGARNFPFSSDVGVAVLKDQGRQAGSFPRVLPRRNVDRTTADRPRGRPGSSTRGRSPCRPGPPPAAASRGRACTLHLPQTAAGRINSRVHVSRCRIGAFPGSDRNGMGSRNATVSPGSGKADEPLPQFLRALWKGPRPERPDSGFSELAARRRSAQNGPMTAAIASRPLSRISFPALASCLRNRFSLPGHLPGACHATYLARQLQYSGICWKKLDHPVTFTDLQ